MPMPYLHVQSDRDFDPARSYPPAAVRADFARRLQARFISRGWSQSELARQSGVSRANISSYVRAKSSPGPAHLKALARALECQPCDLIPAARAATDSRMGDRKKRDACAPQMSLAAMPGGNTAWLQIECELPTAAALRLLADAQAALGAESTNG